MNPAAMEQIAKGWGMRTAAAAAPYRSGSEPSWEEQAFARDAAACSLVWPPRSYSCTFCHREFRSAQALGGHMNVHRRDRARLRHGDSPSPDHDAPPHDQDQDSLMYRAISNLSAATIIKESNNKVLMSLAAVRDQQAIDHDHDDGEDESGRTTKRRRVDHQPAVAALPTIFALVVAPQGGFDHDTDAIKVPKTTASPSSSSLLVDHQQEVDLELRLGSTPKVSSQVFSMPKKKDE